MKKISLWDKFLVNVIGIIPNKPEVKKYLSQCAEKIELERIFRSYIQKIK